MARAVNLRGTNGQRAPGTAARPDAHSAERSVKSPRDGRFRTFFEKSPLPMWVYDPETLRAVEVNASAIAYYGYSRDEFLAAFPAGIVLEEDWPRLRSDAVRVEGQRLGAWRHKRRGGETVDVTIVSQVLEVSGRAAVLMVAQDATETTFEDVPVGLYRSRPDGRVLDVSPRFVRMLGYPTRAAVMGVNAIDVYADPEDRLRWRARLEREGVVTDFECQLRRYDGTRFWARSNARVVRDAAGRPLYYEGAIMDVTEGRQAFALLQALNDIVAAAAGAADLRTFLTALLDRTLTALGGEYGGVWYGTDVHVGRNHPPGFDAEITAAIAAPGVQLTGVEAVEDWATARDSAAEPVASVMRRHGLRASLVAPLLADGRPVGGISIETSHARHWLPEEIRLVEAIGGQIGAVAERLRLLDEVRVHAQEVEALHRLGTALRLVSTLDEAHAVITEHTKALLRGDYAALMLLDPEGTVLRCACVRGIGPTPPGVTYPVRASLFAATVVAGRPFLTADLGAEPAAPEDTCLRGAAGPYAAVPMLEGEKVIGTLVVARRRDGAAGAFTSQDIHALTAVAELASNAIHRTQLVQQRAQELENLRALYASAQRMVETLDLERLARDAAGTCVETFGVSLAWLSTFEANGRPRLLAQAPAAAALPGLIISQWTDATTESAPVRTVTGGEAVIMDLDNQLSPLPWRTVALRHGLHSAAMLPLISRTETFGALMLYSDKTEFFTPDRVAFFRAYAHQLAAALENARLYDDAARKFAQLQALREIDTAITASLDLRVTLGVFLDKVTSLLRVDAAAVFICDSQGRVTSYGAGTGFRTKALERAHARPSEGYAGRVAAERRRVTVDLTMEPGEFAALADFAAEGFRAYHAVALVAKGQVVGVLELFHRQALAPDQGWFDFLDALAGQAAIAIDNAALFDRLQRANAELTLAYDRTIEGWSRALDLRDEETEGHTRRVTELALRLAQEMGVPESDLMHIRRGALLHDIGKMGVPDRILRKPGPLTDEEWAIMRRHPTYAYEFLSSIAYLRRALEIPYCHHERWDGTGYPRGLRGEQIPLEARIFAVADAWDALTSNRPYRSAWTADDARRYIQAQAGHHFDPQIVAVFLRLVQGTPSASLAASGLGKGEAE